MYWVEEHKDMYNKQNPVLSHIQSSNASKRPLYKGYIDS